MFFRDFPQKFRMCERKQNLEIRFLNLNCIRDRKKLYLSKAKQRMKVDRMKIVFEK